MGKNILKLMQDAYLNAEGEFSEKSEGKSVFSRMCEWLNLGNKFIPRAYLSKEAFAKLKQELNIKGNREEILLGNLVFLNRPYIKNGTCDKNHGIFVPFPNEAYENDLELRTKCDFNQDSSHELELIDVEGILRLNNLGKIVRINQLDENDTNAELEIELAKYLPLLANERQLKYSGKYDLIQRKETSLFGYIEISDEKRIGNIRAEKGYTFDSEGNLQKYETASILLPEIQYKDSRILSSEIKIKVRGDDLNGYQSEGQYSIVSGPHLIERGMCECPLSLDSFLSRNLKTA